MTEYTGVILAAGVGRRMNSRIPKVLHQVCGKPMIAHVRDALNKAGVSRVVAVVSPENADAVRGVLGDSVEYVTQEQPLGTGHGVLQCAGVVPPRDSVLVMMGDTPLVQPDSLESLMVQQVESGAAVTLLSASVADQGDLGRVVRDDEGNVSAVVERPDGAGLVVSNEVNAGVYCFDGGWLWENVGRIPPSANGEYYLTWLVEEAVTQGKGVATVAVSDAEEALGVNDRIGLAAAEAAMRRRIAEGWMLQGVTIVDPPSTFIDADVVVGRDSVIRPNTHLQEGSVVGEMCDVGPGTVIRDSSIGARCRVMLSVVEASTLEEDVTVGPYAHLRPGSHAESGVHIGNFVEVKASRLGKGVKLGHFGYVGDADVGANANLGAGLVTCNFDGARKHRTVIGEGAFIGSDTMLVAPVTVGEGAATGAGAVVNSDVPPCRLAVGVPARIIGRSPNKTAGTAE